MPVLTGSVHAHTLTKPSRAGFAVSRSELIEPGAATYVLEAWLGRVSNFKSLKCSLYTCQAPIYQVPFFSCSGKNYAERDFGQL